MTKHAKNSSHLQAVGLPKTMAVEIPLPLLGAFANIEKSFFELCIDSGHHVLQAMMEQDRVDLCGPRWKRDPDRSARRGGPTKSEVTLGGRRMTNAIENPNSGIVTYSRNVKRWQGGTMVVRWVSAAIVEAEKKFRRVKGWRDIEKLIQTLEAKEQKQEAIAKRVA